MIKKIIPCNPGSYFTPDFDGIIFFCPVTLGGNGDCESDRIVTIFVTGL